MDIRLKICDTNNMKKIFLDIETIPADESSHVVLKDIYDSRKSKGKKVADDFDAYLAQTNFDGAFGRILCIGLAVNNEPARILEGDEKDILKKFWEEAETADIFVGHNIFDFDMRFIYQRSIILEVIPSQDLSFARYRSRPIFDTMYEWSKWNMYNKISLDVLTRAMGIKSPKEGEIDGSKVFDYFKAGKLEEIYEYCKADVDAVRAVYKKMIFDL